MNKNKLIESFMIMFLSRSKDIKVQYFRYIVTGGFVTCLDVAILFSLTYLLRINHMSAVVCGFLTAMVITYVLSHFWVFSRDSSLVSAKKHVGDFIVFSGISLVGLLLTVGIIWILYDLSGLHLLFAKFIAIFVVSFWNFLSRKFLVFERKESLVRVEG